MLLFPGRQAGRQAGMPACQESISIMEGFGHFIASLVRVDLSHG